MSARPVATPDRQPVPTADQDQARADLEDALTSVRGIGRLLLKIGADDEGLSYLGYQLIDHENDAMDAFARIFHLNEYAPAGKR